jgi:hypothetical protein
VIAATEPEHVQLNAPEAAVTALAEPVAHKFAVGATVLATPLALPHVPTVVGAKVAVTVQLAATVPVV